MYALEIKNRIISQYRDGASINELASKNHIAKSTLYSWVNTAMKSTQRKAGLTARDVYAMKCNEKRMRQYNEIYSSTGGTVQSPLRDCLSAIDNLIERYSLNILTDALNVRKSTYYSHRKILESITNHDLSD